MSAGLLTILSVIAYICGLVIILSMTPRLYKLSYDEGLFLAIAALDVIGAIFAFGAVEISFAAFNGAFGIRVLDFALLLGIFVVSLRVTLQSLRPYSTWGTFRVSRILAGCLASFYCWLRYLAWCFCSAQPLKNNTQLCLRCFCCCPPVERR